MRRLAPLVPLLSLACSELDPLEQAHPTAQLELRALDFGPVPEGMERSLPLPVANVGPVPLHLSFALADQGSSDFSLESSTLEVAGLGRGELRVRYRPVGQGSDQRALRVQSDDPQAPQTEVELKGGPIAASLLVSPNPVDFAPATSATVARAVALENTGSANLSLSELSIDPQASPDFVLRPYTLPGPLAPSERFEVVIDYRRSARGGPGSLVVRSDDPLAPEMAVRLIPDPFRACENQLDDDLDGLSDWPDDPGCTSATDDDESNSPECTDGTTEACGSSEGTCRPGTRGCANRLWGPCEGAILPAPELCDGLDNDCDQRIDEELTEACTVNGCAGVRGCVEGSSVPGGAWTACLPVGGGPELCDGLDNDCDGTIDDGVVESCVLNGCAGTRICVPGGTGTYTACQVMSSPESCNGLDDDCNGLDDDGIPDLICGTGACRTAAPGCVAGAPGTCTPGTPGAESCNGLDDDCNGTADDLPAVSCGTGTCRRTVAACIGGAPNTCTPGMAGTEICNGLDDDCDGTADDGLVCGGSCGLMSTAADPQEPNNSTATARPSVPAGSISTHVYNYDLTLPPSDTDWIEFVFPAVGTASFAQLLAEITCTSWAGAGCGAASPNVGLEAWYIDDCFPQLDSSNNGTSGLATVSSSGPVSSFGICGIQRFRVHAIPSTTVCAGEALNAHVRVTVTWTP